MDDAAVARQRIEVAGVEDVPVVGLVQHRDRPRIARGKHVQDDAADRGDACVAGEEHDRALVAVGQKEVAVRPLDRYRRSRLEPLQRRAPLPRTHPDAELHRPRPLRRRGDRVRARDPLGEAEVHPLAGLEAEHVVGKGDGDLEDARRELLDLGHDGGV